MITHKVSCPIIISAQSSFSSKDLHIFNKSSPLFQNIPTFTFNLPQKFVNFNYLNVAFISYKLTMWDLMLFSGCHTRGQRLRKKDSSC